MKAARFLSLAAVLALTVSSAHGALINEVRTDQGGSDLDEYFELSGAVGESLNGLTYLVIGDDNPGSGAMGGRSGIIEAVIDLTGQTIPADGYFLAAEASFTLVGGGEVDLTTSINFENSDNVTHLLVSGFSGASGDLLDTDRNGTIDVTPWTAVIDSLSLIESTNPPTTTFNEWDYTGDPALTVNNGLGPDGTFVPGHSFRSADGSSAWAIGSFGTAVGPGPSDSPGDSNLIPEPATITLLAFGAIGLIRRRRA